MDVLDFLLKQQKNPSIATVNCSTLTLTIHVVDTGGNQCDRREGGLIPGHFSFPLCDLGMRLKGSWSHTQASSVNGTGMSLFTEWDGYERLWMSREACK